MAWFVLLVLALAGGVLAYRWLVNLEKEIRAEIASAEAMETSAEDSALSSAKPTAPGNQEPASPLLEAIRSKPGILQKDLYVEVPNISRAQIQKELLELDRSGKISRVRSGNTYQLNLND